MTATSASDPAAPRDRAAIDGGRPIDWSLTSLDYAMRNYSIEHFPGGCLCGAGNCRGSVTGWKDLPRDRKRAYDGLVAPYLLEIDRERAGVGA